jgi:transposase
MRKARAGPKTQEGASPRERRDYAEMGERRMLGARLLREGVWQAEVARRLGVHRQSVSRWARKLKRGGERALGAGRVGRPPRLHREDLRRLEGRLKRGTGSGGPEQWTSRRMAELIERECRVKYDVSQAWRILRGLGWSYHPNAPKSGAMGRAEWRGGGRWNYHGG